MDSTQSSRELSCGKRYFIFILCKTQKNQMFMQIFYQNL